MLNNTEEFQGIDTKLSRYREVFDIGQLKGGAWLFKDLKVLHINSVKKGGGVAAILSHIIPLFNDIGIESHWWVPEIFDNDFFKAAALLISRSPLTVIRPFLLLILHPAIDPPKIV